MFECFRVCARQLQLIDNLHDLGKGWRAATCINFRRGIETSLKWQQARLAGYFQIFQYPQKLFISK